MGAAAAAEWRAADSLRIRTATAATAARLGLMRERDDDDEDEARGGAQKRREYAFGWRAVGRELL